MPARTANARWEGGLKGGKGNMRFGGGAFEGQYSFSSRFEEGTGTNPEELIAAAHAGCFSMAFSGGLERSGHVPNSVETVATVDLFRNAAQSIAAVTRTQVDAAAEKYLRTARRTVGWFRPADGAAS